MCNINWMNIQTKSKNEECYILSTIFIYKKNDLITKTLSFCIKSIYLLEKYGVVYTGYSVVYLDSWHVTWHLKNF